MIDVLYQRIKPVKEAGVKNNLVIVNFERIGPVKLAGVKNPLALVNSAPWQAYSSGDDLITIAKPATP
jgi:hypothetical protein